jgi:hypothetical protein
MQRWVAIFTRNFGVKMLVHWNTGRLILMTKKSHPTWTGNLYHQYQRNEETFW